MTGKRKKPKRPFIKKYRPWKERRFLVVHYVYKKQTAQTIADFVGCSQNTILNWLHKYNLPMRKAGWAGHIEPDRSSS